MDEPIEHCYLDTSLLTAATILLEDHTAATSFCRRLFADGSTVYVSDLVRLEYMQAVRNLQSKVDEVTRRQFRLNAWGSRPEVRARWIAAGMRELDQLLDQFAHVREIQINGQMVRHAQELMASCNLESYDAVHVAATLAAGVSDLAAVDGHYRRAGNVLNIHLVRGTL